jgi:hypothetical protein
LVAIPPPATAVSAAILVECCIRAIATIACSLWVIALSLVMSAMLITVLRIASECLITTLLRVWWEGTCLASLLLLTWNAGVDSRARTVGSDGRRRLSGVFGLSGLSLEARMTAAKGVWSGPTKRIPSCSLLALVGLSRASATIQCLAALHACLSIASGIGRRSRVLVARVLLGWLTIHRRLIVIGASVLLLVVAIAICIWCMLLRACLSSASLTANIIKSWAVRAISTSHLAHVVATILPSVLRILLIVRTWIAIAILSIAGLPLRHVARMLCLMTLDRWIRSIMPTILSIWLTVAGLWTTRGILALNILAG